MLAAAPPTPSMQTLLPEDLRANVFLALQEMMDRVDPLSKKALAARVMPLFPVIRTSAVINRLSFIGDAALDLAAFVEPMAGLETPG